MLRPGVLPRSPSSLPEADLSSRTGHVESVFLMIVVRESSENPLPGRSESRGDGAGRGFTSGLSRVSQTRFPSFLGVRPGVFLHWRVDGFTRANRSLVWDLDAPARSCSLSSFNAGFPVPTYPQPPKRSRPHLRSSSVLQSSSVNTNWKRYLSSEASFPEGTLEVFHAFRTFRKSLE